MITNQDKIATHEANIRRAHRQRQEGGDAQVPRPPDQDQQRGLAEAQKMKICKTCRFYADDGSCRKKPASFYRCPPHQYHHSRLATDRRERLVRRAPTGSVRHRTRMPGHL